MARGCRWGEAVRHEDFDACWRLLLECRPPVLAVEKAVLPKGVKP